MDKINVYDKVKTRKRENMEIKEIFT